MSEEKNKAGKSAAKKSAALTKADKSKKGESKKLAESVVELPKVTPKVAPKAAEPMQEKPASPSPEERQRWIANAAYHRAEKRGFMQGYELQDWLDAEREITALIG